MYKYVVSDGGKEWEVFRFPFELVDSNMFFLPSGNTGIVIDPNENDELLEVFGKYGTRRILIVLTHEHYDHTIGVEWLQSKIDSWLFCHKACADAIATEKGNNPKTLAILLTIRDAADGGHRRDEFMATAKRYVLKADETFDSFRELTVGGIDLICYPTPGHSKGSAIYFLGDKCVFTGDSLIQHTPTILKLPGSDKEVFQNITKPFLKSLDKKKMVFPGHGEPFRLGEADYLYK